MHTKLAAALAVMALLGGCAKKESETGALDRDRSGVDTVVKSSAVKDTTVVKADTNINVDTLKKTDHIEKKKN
jgi:ABC-type uncharacterized transport system auxiliary subunit